MQTRIIERYFFFSLLFAVFVFSFFIFRPFWTVLVLGISFSIVLYPIYEWLHRKKIPNWIASILTVLFFVIIIGIPAFAIGAVIFNQSQNVYHLITSNNPDALSFLDSLNKSVNNILPQGITFDLHQKISELFSFVISNIASVFSSALSTAFSIFLTLLSIFYFLKDGARWRRALIVLSPLSDVDDKKIINKLARAVNGIIKGYLLIAVIQGIMMWLGLELFGVPNPALWGLVTMFTALIPTIGTAMVSVPAIIYLFLTGNIIEAVGMLCWAVGVVGMIDNLLSPVVVGNKIDLPPFLILFSVLGGIALLGPIGILVGPLTISLLYTLVSIYRNEFQQTV